MIKKLDYVDFEQVFELLENSFPIDERSNYIEQKRLLNKSEYVLMGEKNQDEVMGFAAIWEFNEFIYIEHFAVKRELRNKGIGKSILNELEKTFKKTIILEVELPNSEISKRRIRFYERNGFYYNEYHYVQLAYSKDRNPVELKIMSYPQKLDENEFENVKSTLYSKLFEE